MKIDCHTHTNRFSPCSQLAPDELLFTAVERGLDAVAFTEHEHFWPRKDISWLRKAFPEINLFIGVETAVGGNHVVVFLPEADPGVLKLDSAPRLWEMVDSNGGYAYVAHPFRFNSHFGQDNPDYPFPGLEVASYNMKDVSAVEKSIQFARDNEVDMLTASDAHSEKFVGNYYLELESTVENEKELCNCLRAGNFTPVAPGL